MNNYAVNHRLQFSSNIAGNYRFAVVSDPIITGKNSSLDQLKYFLNRALAHDTTNILHLGPALSRDDAAAWPRIPGLTTYCLALPRHPSSNGAPGRSDLVAAPTGFVLTHRGRAVPIFLHYRPGSPVAGIGENMGEKIGDGVGDDIGDETSAVHLVGGLSEYGFQELPNGGVIISVGTFPPVGAIIELWFDISDELKCETHFWEFGNLR